jgi:predicted ABC-type exoprotein transport system permease subunit
MIKDILANLKEQRWDDHRYYHHSRINQFLHLVSASSFLIAYVYLFIDPVVSAYIAWLISMTTRQAGHFFFEPKGYDNYNNATFEHKEDIKVGFNLKRKRVLMTCFVLIPILAYFDLEFMNYLVPHQDSETFLNRIGIGWLWLGVIAIVFRMVQLTAIQTRKVAITWCIKILTDPFHDVWIYRKSPFYLMQGQLIDPDLKQDYE